MSRSNALAVLVASSHHSPKTISETTLPRLFALLPDHAPPRDADEARAAYWRTLSSLSTLCVQPSLCETLVIQLITKLELVASVARRAISSTDTPNNDVLECHAAYAYSILGTLDGVFTTKAEANHIDIPNYIDKFIPRLYTFFIGSAVSSHPQNQIAANPRLIEVAARIVTTITRPLSAE